jgi:hypothetical protein
MRHINSGDVELLEESARRHDDRLAQHPHDDRHVQRQPEPAKPPHTRDTLAQEFVTKRDVAGLHGFHGPVQNR